MRLIVCVVITPLLNHFSWMHELEPNWLSSFPCLLIHNGFGYVNHVHVLVVAHQDFRGWVSGFEVEAVDTTGAGDSFVGGFLSILAAHKHIYKVTTLLFYILLSNRVGYNDYPHVI